MAISTGSLEVLTRRLCDDIIAEMNRCNLALPASAAGREERDRAVAVLAAGWEQRLSAIRRAVQSSAAAASMQRKAGEQCAGKDRSFVFRMQQSVADREHALESVRDLAAHAAGLIHAFVVAAAYGKPPETPKLDLAENVVETLQKLQASATDLQAAAGAKPLPELKLPGPEASGDVLGALALLLVLLRIAHLQRLRRLGQRQP